MLVKLFDKNPDSRTVQRIVKVLRDGGIIIYPTDTIYAIGCDIFQARAVEKICQIKGVSPQKSTLSMICSNLSHISEYARISNTVFKLLKHNTPGPFTFILNGSNSLPKLFKQRKTVGVRVPDRGLVQAIVEELGNPLLSASLKDYEGWGTLVEDSEKQQVNFSDDNSSVEYTTDPELIEERYGRLVDLVIDGGIGGTEPSTVVDCTDDEPVVVRQGAGCLQF